KHLDQAQARLELAGRRRDRAAEKLGGPMERVVGRARLLGEPQEGAARARRVFSLLLALGEVGERLLRRSLAVLGEEAQDPARGAQVLARGELLGELEALLPVESAREPRALEIEDALGGPEEVAARAVGDGAQRTDPVEVLEQRRRLRVRRFSLEG